MENFDKYYRSYKYMQKHLATDFTANYLNTNLEDNDKGQDVLSGKLNEKVIDMEWVTAIEDTLPYIEKAIDEQRRFIVENNEVYRIDKAKIINKDSVKHLIQHTNFIDNIDEDGKVTPNKVLTIEREDSFETYENRFLITLIEHAMAFVGDKYRKMVDAPTDTFNKVEMDRDIVLNNQHITFKVEYSNEVKDAQADDLNIKDFEKLSDFDRVRRIREKLNSFLNTEMMQQLKKSVRVKPPINRTNLMTKNPNYKACLDLFNYLYAYSKPGFEIVGRDFTGSMDKEVQEGLYFSLGFQHFMLSISTNPALKKMLEERYQEHKRRREKGEDSETSDLIEKIRQEEMKIRLQEIRDREKIIRDQKAEIAALKREIEKRDRTIESLKSTIHALEEQIKQLRDELDKVKAELIKAQMRIAELEAKVEELEARIKILEAKIVELEAKVAELEKIKAELEAKIAELEQIIEEQKAKIAELEDIVAKQKARIEELEAYVAELEKIKAQLEEKVKNLEAENAAQKATIEAHEATIASQKEAIAGLESEIASAKQEISQLSETLTERDKTIAEQSETIDTLNKNLANLTTELADEKESHKADVEAEKLSHSNHVSELNTLFEGEKASIEETHNKAVAKLKKEHKAAIDKVKKQCDTDKARIQKDADSRVKAAQKDADKKAKEEIKKQTAKAQAEAKKAAKKASDTAAKFKKELKIEKGDDGLFRYDFTLGALGVQSMKAVSLSEADGVFQMPHTNNLACIYIVKDNKKLTVYSGKFNHLEVVKKFSSSNLDDCKELVADTLKKADKSCAYLTFKSLDKLVVNSFADFIRNDAEIASTEIFHNKNQKSGKSTLGIYYYRG
ncbi:MAG: hypothetical protein J1E41_02415 [Ruminococcus sp.]|nr:hypothetical protein [Ruminococcus sp.]